MTRSTFSIEPTKQNAEFIKTIENKNSFFNQVINLIRDNKIQLTIENSPHKTQIELIDKADETIEAKIKRQQLLKLQLSNWKDLKNNGMIMEEAMAILRGTTALKEPSLNDAPELVKRNPQKCYLCHHEHHQYNKHICSDSTCECAYGGRQP